jgi:hypothetical protein
MFRRDGHAMPPDEIPDQPAVLRLAARLLPNSAAAVYTNGRRHRDRWPPCTASTAFAHG